MNLDLVEKITSGKSLELFSDIVTKFDFKKLEKFLHQWNSLNNYEIDGLCIFNMDILFQNALDSNVIIKFATIILELSPDLGCSIADGMFKYKRIDLASFLLKRGNFDEICKKFLPNDEIDEIDPISFLCQVCDSLFESDLKDLNMEIEGEKLSVGVKRISGKVYLQRMELVKNYLLLDLAPIVSCYLDAIHLLM